MNTYWIDFIYSFATFITLTANPVSIEVGTDSIQHFAWKSIILPLLSVEFQDTFIHQVFTILQGTIRQYYARLQAETVVVPLYRPYPVGATWLEPVSLGCF